MPLLMGSGVLTHDIASAKPPGTAYNVTAKEVVKTKGIELAHFGS